MYRYIGRCWNIFVFLYIVRKLRDIFVSFKKKGKKGKKKNFWLDSEEESEGGMSDFDMDGSFMENLKFKIDRLKREISE